MTELHHTNRKGNSAPAASDFAYETLRSQILSGEIAPGERLKERDICAELGVSRTPVREALGRLSAEGLVVDRPRRGMIVAQIDPETLREVFELGAILEAYAARLAARKAKDEDIERLTKLLGEMKKSLRPKTRDYKTYIRLDHAFHQAIADIADNQQLANTLTQANNIRLLSQVFQEYAPADYENSYQHHEFICRAIAARDEIWASAAMSSHVRDGRQTSLAARSQS